MFIVRKAAKFGLFARESDLLCCSQGSQVCFVVRKEVESYLLLARESSYVC